MPDYPADGAVVEVVRSLAAEENSLQDPGRKLDGVLQRRVEGVHHGGPAVSDLQRAKMEIYPAFSLVELLHYCALIGRELQSVEIFSCTERSYYRRP